MSLRLSDTGIALSLGRRKRYPGRTVGSGLNYGGLDWVFSYLSFGWDIM